jgi:hypothetical protein
MFQLNNHKWKELDGGYRTPYDASIPLKILEEAKITEEVLPLQVFNKKTRSP